MDTQETMDRDTDGVMTDTTAQTTTRASTVTSDTHMPVTTSTLGDTTHQRLSTTLPTSTTAMDTMETSDTTATADLDTKTSTTRIPTTRPHITSEYNEPNRSTT